MTSLVIPTYNTKDEVYADLEGILSHIPREDVFLAHFKTGEFIAEEAIHQVVENFSIRSTPHNLRNYQIPVMPGLKYKIATCLFSENGKTLGLRKHIHLPKTPLPTITIGKKVYSGKDDVEFKFHRKTSPSPINLVEDFVLRFDSCTMPHEVVVADGDQSIWLFIVFEHCGDVDLEKVKNFYNCEVIYDFHG